MKRSYLYPVAVISAIMLVSSCSKDDSVTLESVEYPEEVYTKSGPSASIPDGNSNMPCGGTISTNHSEYNGHTIGKLVDNSRSSYFATKNYTYNVIWSSDEAFSLKSYIIYSSDSDLKVPENWVLSASADNVSWVEIDSRSGVNYTGRKERKEFYIDDYYNHNFYRYYKFEFQSSNRKTAIAELKLREMAMAPSGEENIDDLMGLIRDNTYSSETPMGQFCEGRHRTTNSDRNWLANPSKEPTTVIENGDNRWRTKNVTLYPFGTPLPADVNQGGIGDCSALAVFASMAYLYPNFIEDIITNNGNGSYTVKMYDPEGQEVDVTVSSKFLNSCAKGKNEEFCWTSILEKAIMKWNSIYHCNDMLDGIATEHTSPLFVGNGESFAFDSGVLNYNEMDRAVRVLLNSGWLVIGGFSEEDVVIGNGPYKTVSAHAYTFVFDSSTSASYGMRNPWGVSAGVDWPDPHDGVAPIVNDGRTQPLIDIRTCNPGAALAYKQSYLLPYTPPVW